MPQFDVFSFFSQIFWTLTFLLFFMVLVCYFILPSVSVILKTRKRVFALTTSDQVTASVTTTIFTGVKVDNVTHNSSLSLGSLSDNSRLISLAWMKAISTLFVQQNFSKFVISVL